MPDEMNTDERAKFEAFWEIERKRTWMESGCHKLRGAEPSINWAEGAKADAWRGWQGRASLSAAEPAIYQLSPSHTSHETITEVIKELRTYNPQGDEHGGKFIHKGWADQLEAVAPPRISESDSAPQAAQQAPAGAAPSEPSHAMYAAAQKILIPTGDDDGGSIMLNTSQVRALWQSMLSAAPAEAASPWTRALEIRIAQGWKLKGDRLPVLYTDTINDEGVGRDDLWLCTTSALAAPAAPSTPASGGWLSIKKAPKDGTEFLVVYGRQGNVKQLARWNSLYGHWESKGTWLPGFESNVTAIYLLPASPTIEGESK